MKRFIVYDKLPLGWGIHKRWHADMPRYELVLNKQKYEWLTDKIIYQKINQLKD
jgi:hypothetical protein